MIRETNIIKIVCNYKKNSIFATDMSEEGVLVGFKSYALLVLATISEQFRNKRG